MKKEMAGTKSLIDSMYSEAERLKTFKDWPFNENSKCSAAKMAEAGFFHCPSDKEPDLVQCYVCYKELDGWVAEDEPWDEHLSHAKYCIFAQLHKSEKSLKISEIFAIESERKQNKIKRLAALRLENFRAQRREIEDCYYDIMDELKKGK